MTLYSGNKAYLCRRCFQEQQRAVEQALVTTNFLCFKSKRLALIFSPPEHNCVYEHPSALSSALYFPPAVSLLPCPHGPSSSHLMVSLYAQVIFHVHSSHCRPVPFPPPHTLPVLLAQACLLTPYSFPDPSFSLPKGDHAIYLQSPCSPPLSPFMHTFSVPFPATQAAYSSLPLQCKSFCFWILCTFPQDLLSPTFLHSALSDSIPPPFAQHSIQPGTKQEHLFVPSMQLSSSPFAVQVFLTDF